MAWTYKYVDSALGSGANDGSSEANAWRGVDAIKTGLETNHAAETKVIYRRTSVFDIGAGSTAADIAPTDDGTAPKPAYHIGMPRQAIPNTTITEGDWTNGSNSVDNVVGITPGMRAHCGRYITAPDGKKYLITAVLWEFTIDGMAAGAEFAVGEILTNTTQTKKGKVWKFVDNLDTTGLIQAIVDSSTAWVNNDNITSGGGGDAELSANATAVGFVIDREYAGSTVTGTSGKFQIDEDEDYAELHAAGVGASWEADAHDLPKIDFNDGAYQLILDGDMYFSIRNFYIENSSDVNGILYVTGSTHFELLGCILKQASQNTYLFVASGGESFVIDRCILEGSGSGSSQRGIRYSAVCEGKIKNSAVYNCGDYGLNPTGSCYIGNVNIGYEMANGDYDIAPAAGTNLWGMNVILGGTVGYILLTQGPRIQIENYQKILGWHRKWDYFLGYSESVLVTSTNANKKLSDTVLRCYPNVNTVLAISNWKTVLFDGVFRLNSGSQTIKFWIYNDLGQTINDVTAKDNLYLEAIYYDSYDDTSEYTEIKAYSTEIDIADAADADDWDYLQVTVNPAVASDVRVRFIASIYDATDYFLVDPQPVIT